MFPKRCVFGDRFHQIGVGVGQTEGKILRFRTKTDTRGRGFSTMHSEKKNAEFFLI